MAMETEGKYAGEFILSEAPGDRSRDQVTVDSSVSIQPGDVLGQKTVGAATVTPGAPVGAGNGAAGVWTADAGAPDGVYQIVIQAASANAGAGVVLKPDGSIDGPITVGVAYNGTINGTLADGSTDWAAGTRIPITVTHAEGNDRYVPVNPAATDGSAKARAIAWRGVTTGAGETAQLLVIKREAEVIDERLGFGALDTNQKAQARLDLASRGIICR